MSPRCSDSKYPVDGHRRALPFNRNFFLDLNGPTVCRGTLMRVYSILWVVSVCLVLVLFLTDISCHRLSLEGRKTWKDLEWETVAGQGVIFVCNT